MIQSPSGDNGDSGVFGGVKHVFYDILFFTSFEVENDSRDFGNWGILLTPQRISKNDCDKEEEKKVWSLGFF